MKPTPTQMFEGIQFHLLFGETITISWQDGNLLFCMKGGSLPSDSGTEYKKSCHVCSPFYD